MWNLSLMVTTVLVETKVNFLIVFFCVNCQRIFQVLNLLLFQIRCYLELRGFNNEVVNRDLSVSNAISYLEDISQIANLSCC